MENKDIKNSNENKDVKNNDSYKERFEFVLSMNDNVVCQRYFRINRFDERSIYSLDLLTATQDIVALIDENLKSKSRIFTWFTNHPQLEYPEDALEYGKGIWVHTPRTEDDIPPVAPEWTNTFKFAFKVDGREVISRIWDGSSYPKMIAENVDLMNRKPKVENFEFSRAKLELLMQWSMNVDKENLVPVIIRMLCDATAKGDRDKGYMLAYGDTMYRLEPEVEKDDIEEMLGSNPYFKGSN